MSSAARNAFAGNIADGKRDAAAFELEHVVVVAADAVRGTAASGERHAGDCRSLLREEALLDFVSDFELAVGAGAAGSLVGERMGKLADFERETGLCGDGLEKAKVRGGVGFLGFFGSESDDAHQAIAAG
jgi:hypothetical protein